MTKDIFLNDQDVEQIKKRLSQNPWKSAYSKLIVSADSANRSYETIPSVILGETPPDGDRHNYYTKSPYCYYTSTPGYPCYTGATRCFCRDGQINPAVIRTDYSNIQKFRDAVRNLGIAYRLSGYAKYADAAVRWIRKWCVDTNYKMNPVFKTFKFVPSDPKSTFDAQVFNEIPQTLVGVCYGASLIWNYSGFGNKYTFESWIRSLLSRIPNPSVDPNNIKTWGWVSSQLSYICAGSIIIGDITRLNRSFETWKILAGAAIDTNDKKDYSIKHQRNRYTGLSYSHLWLAQMTNIAEIAFHHNVDLYHYKNNLLKKSLDFHAKYCVDPTDWPYNGGSRYSGQSADVYELAYTRLAKSDAYKKCIIKWGGVPRYFYEERGIGPVTLTHGSSLSTISTPSITVLSPNGGEIWRIGSTQDIKWKTVGITGSSLKIELLKSGITKLVISYWAKDDGIFSWKLPTLPVGSDYKIRITGCAGTDCEDLYSDMSNSNFSIN